MRRKDFISVLIIMVLFTWLIMPMNSSATELLSQNESGVLGNGQSTYKITISRDGRYVVFTSEASNLVPDDTNGVWDVFLFDRQTGSMERISVATDGTQANDGSAVNSQQGISDDGRYVAFASQATNLISGTTVTPGNVYVRDRLTGTTEIVSVNPSGDPGLGGQPIISADGRYVVFISIDDAILPPYRFTYPALFIRDRVLGTTDALARYEDGTPVWYPMEGHSISSDGPYVTFSTIAQLVPGATGNPTVYVKDIVNGTYEIVAEGSGQASISSTGRYVAFVSGASTLVSGDTNGVNDVFWYDRQTSTFERMSVSSTGAEANDASFDPVISSDGNYVVFDSVATNLVSSDTNGWIRDSFIRDRASSTTELIDVDSTGVQGNNMARYPTIGDDGYVVFYSMATNLVSNDTNGVPDIFARDLYDHDSDGYDSSVDCDDDDPGINPGAAEVIGDGIDQDCNGLDLTINITKANYQGNKSQLTVWATSDFGASANLKLDVPGYSTVNMTWGGNRWEYTMTGVSPDPGSVTVWGDEGAVSELTN